MIVFASQLPFIAFVNELPFLFWCSHFQVVLSSNSLTRCWRICEIVIESHPVNCSDSKCVNYRACSRCRVHKRKAHNYVCNIITQCGYADVRAREASAYHMQYNIDHVNPLYAMWVLHFIANRNYFLQWCFYSRFQYRQTCPHYSLFR